MKTIHPILCVFLSIVVLPSLAPSASPEDAFHELMEATDESQIPARLDAVLTACDNDPEKVRALIASDVYYIPYPAGWTSITSRVRDGETELPLEVHIRIPRDYDPAKSYPLLLAAHGQHQGGGMGIGRAMERLLGENVERYLLVAPTLPGEARFNARPYQEQTFLLPLQWAKRNLNVDDDRVYVSGYSQGGHVSWHLAVLFPDLFASAVPMAGVPWFEGSPHTGDMYLENLAHLPVWAIWGEKDAGQNARDLGNRDFCRQAAARLGELQNEHFRGTELVGVGHKGCEPAPREFAAYLAKHTRATIPQSITHRFHLEHHGRSYWLGALELTAKPIDFSQGLRVEILSEAPPTPEEAKAAIRKEILRNLFEFSGELDREANALKLRGKRVRRLKVQILDGMLDVSRPLTVRFMSGTWKGEIPVSARCMLEHYARTRDATRLVLNELDIKNTGKGEWVYE